MFGQIPGVGGSGGSGGAATSLAITGTTVTVCPAMSGTTMDITKPGEAYSATGDASLAFSSTLATGQSYVAELIADASAHTITIPSSFSLNRQANITSIALPANATLFIVFKKEASRIVVISGDPVLTIGPSLGRFALGGVTETLASNVINWSNTDSFATTLSANTTLSFASNSDGFRINVAVTNTANNWTVTWPTVKWANSASAPVQSTGANTDVWSFIQFGNTIYGAVVQRF